MSTASKHISPRQAVVVWLLLVVASVSIGWLGDHQGVFGQWTVAVVMLVALLKARAIILYYMEVKHAPLRLRLPFEAWALAAFGIILGGWFFL
jgi:caa(3)-type oxidase subunit IV